MKKTDLAYVAGIVDGEGYISIVRNKCKPQTLLQVGVGNTNQWLIEWLHFSFGGCLSSHEEGGNCKTTWKWVISSKKASEFLKLILPYLKMKRSQAELALQFQSERRWCNKHHPKTEKEKALEEVQRLLMGQYNKKGINSEGVTDRSMPT